MKKLLRILGVILLFIVLALIAIPFLFEGRIQEEIQKVANENLTATLSFSDVSLSLISNFPNASVGIEDLKIEGKDAFEGVPLVNAKEIKATVDLFSLFGDEIKVKSIELIEPALDVRILQNGKANYDIAKETEADSSAVASEESPGAFALSLQSYEIQNGSLSYSDATLPMNVQLTGLNHSGSGDFTQDLFTLATQTMAETVTLSYDGVDYVKNATMELQADLEIDNENSKYSFKENSLLLNQLALAIDGWVAMPEDDIDMDIRFQTTDTEILHLLSMVPAEFASDLSGVSASGTMDLNGYVRGTYNENSLPGMMAMLKVDNGRFKYSEMPQSAENIAIDMKVDASNGLEDDRMTIDVNQFYMELANNPVDITFHLKNPYTDPDIDAAVQAKVIFASLAEVIPMEKGDKLDGSLNANFKLNGRLSAIEEERYNDFEAEGNLVILDLTYRSDSVPYDLGIRSAYMNFSPKFITLSSFDGKVGTVDLKADGKIDEYLNYALRDSMLTGRFNLRSPNMDLNQFMESDAEEETADASTAEEDAYGKVVLPGNVDFRLNARFERMLYEDLEITDANGSIHLVNGTATLEGLSLKTLGGTVMLDGSYDSKPESALLAMDFRIQNMDIQRTAEAFNTIDKLAPIAKSCTGKFSTNMRLDCALNEKMEPIEPTINGGGRLQTKGVTVEEFPPLTKVADELGIKELKNPSIQDVNITYAFKDGRVYTDPFTVKLDGVPTTIEGSMSFSQELDYTAKMDVPVSKLPGNLSNQASSLLQDINDKLGSNLSAGTAVPVSLRITGTVEDPKVAGNYGELLQNKKEDLKEEVKEVIKQEVEEKVEEVKEDAVAKAREEAEKMLSEAQQKADNLMADARKNADRIKNEAYKEAQKVEDSAKNVLEKAAKKAAADKIRKEADKAHDKAIQKAQEQADKIMSEAQKNADAKIKAAEEL